MITQLRWANALSKLAIAAALASAACTADAPSGQAPPPPDTQNVVPSGVPGIELRALPRDPARPDEVRVEAVLDVPKAPSARVMELFVKHSPELEYVDAAKGTALDAAGKELVVQSKGADLVRAVAFSAGSTASIGSGTLVTYRFTAKGPGPFRLEVTTDKPVFAPPAANAGLHVSEPIEVRF